MNGFHDGANSISTIVATGVLTPKQAVLFAAFFNFAALWVFQLKVAATIGKGTVEPAFVDYYVIFGALCGALIWNLITWYYGIPSSSSHALIGGLVGATVAKAGGLTPIVWSGFGKILVFIVVSPFVGFMLGGLLMVLVAWVFRNKTPAQVRRWFNYAQIFTSGAYSLAHGGNDAQKTIGIIWLLLITAGAATTDVATLPNWVIYACYFSIAWGTYLGGWRIVKTMGTKITKLNSVSGSCASMGGALSLGLATLGGIPVSTTHTITGAIAGAGAHRAVRRG
jgi:PiT family inorganic phosphate transporter